MKLDIEAKKKSDGILLACGIVLLERPDGLMQFAEYEVCEPIEFEVFIDTNCTRNEKKVIALFLSFISVDRCKVFFKAFF